MRLWPQRKTTAVEATGRERSALSIEEYLRQLNDYFTFGGNTYPIGINQSIPGKPQEPIPNDFIGYIRGAYKSDGIVFACILARMALFSQGRFQFRRFVDGKPQDLFGTPALKKLERPWPGGKTSDLLARMEQDASLGGNSYTLNRGLPGLRRLRPDWTTIIIDSDAEDPRDIAWDPNAEVVGYAYTTGGPASGNAPMVFRPDLVAHYAPIPDPEASFRGMSWLTPIVTEIMGDKAASEHKLDFFERGGTPNWTIEYNPEYVKDEDAFNDWMEAIEDQVAKFSSSNRRLHLGGGTKANVIGSSFEQIEFKATQGAGETRIASAAGVPAVVLGISEGLQGSSLNAGNYQASMRRFSDMTMAWLWQAAADALDTLIVIPPSAELVVDTRYIPALQADRTDAAEIQSTTATTIRTLTDGGYKAESVIAAVVNDDWNLLEYDPTKAPVQTRPATNGSGSSQDAQQAVDAATN